MHAKTSTVGFGAATALALSLSIVLLAPGCSSAHREPDASPADLDQGDTASNPPAAPNTGGPATSAESIESRAEIPGAEQSGAEPSPEVLAELVEYGPFPGEEITGSPLDLLADVSPKIDLLSLEPEPVEVPVPSYDIPMITNDKVAFWLDYYANKRHTQFQAGLERSGRYMYVFREVFQEEGLPLDLIYMAHVESAYKTTAYSRARARGIFQFISGTGKHYGLRIDYWVDERLDPEKSARAAAAYLKDLYAEFGDWYLALAGYNAGEGKIRRALARSGRDDFWGIAKTRYIRRETKNYVPAILAAVMISKDPEKYGFDFEADSPVVYETIEIEGAVDLQVLARCAGSDLDRLKLLNPALRRYQTPPHARTKVHVPVGASEATLAALEKVPQNERVLYARHRVRSGDTLYDLARDYGVSVSAIQQSNKMGRRTVIRVGDELIIPTVAAGSYSAPAGYRSDTGAVPGEPLTYRVRRGDTLSGIARRYRSSPTAIATASGISVNRTLHPGDRLTVIPGVRSSEQARRITGGDPGSADGTVVHRVRRGESLSVIARRYDTRPSAIAAANGISVNKLLQIGERLTVVPGARSRSQVLSVVHGGERSRNGSLVHTVQRGDSLWRIADQYNTTVDRICSLNRISEGTTLYPGTKLTVSASK
jgi:membrane-bound lytic murein transglycosylase D